MPGRWIHRVFPALSSRSHLLIKKRLFLLTIVLVAAGGWAFVVYQNIEKKPLLTARVRRTSFDISVLAAGRIESDNMTEIKCNLKRVGSGTAPTILSLAEDGTNVKAGQILCEIDSTDYQELVRRQTITVSQAKASKEQAELNLEVAKIAMDSYLQGEVAQTEQMYKGQLSLAKSDIVQREDRLAWTKRMANKGYFAVQQVATEEQALMKSAMTLAQTEGAFGIYQKFSAPMTRRALESQINGAQSTLDFETIKFNRETERLVLYKAQVDFCTIKAPHDGFLVHANRQGRSVEVFEGATVREGQKLFTLPDLSKMVAQVYLHETTVNQVKPGMPARIQVEAVPGRTYEGWVTSIAAMPYAEPRSRDSPQTEVTYFIGQVQLGKLTDALRPGMSAELEILTGRRQDVIAVPSQAISIDHGRDVCYVVHEESLECRPVVVGASNHLMKEIVEGLKEGEVVLLIPDAADGSNSPERKVGPSSEKAKEPVGPPSDS